MDTLANAMNSIKVAETRGKPDAVVKPASRLIKDVLSLLKNEGYINDYELLDDGKSGEFVVRLEGKINAAGVVKPRFSVKKDEWEKYEQRFLPARDLGLLLVSTSQGVITHNEAKKRGIGGKLLAYTY
ncbi:MAG TPA: 30S ribosomal protein S8 [Candidatus Norongarragalinales archaeon]|nr:30S ribosomal protein S8 [Candidatus Norongarragalinales archaeon]